MLRIICWSIFSVLFLASCNSEQENQETSTTGTFIALKHAKGFTIEEFDGYKIIRVSNPWTTSKQAFQYLLISDSSKILKEHQSIEKRFNVPLQNMGCLSSTYVAFADQLGLVDQIVCIDNQFHINNLNVIDRIKSRKIIEVGSNDNINIEYLLNLKPNIVFTYGVNTMEEGILGKAQKLNIPLAFFAEYHEETPLARAEWIKFMGAFFGLEAKADSIFNEIETQYLSLKAKTKLTTKKPSVFTGKQYDDLWVAAGGNSYMAKLIKDAGGDYIWGDDPNTGAIKFDFEYVFTEAAETDFWICNIMNWYKPEDLLKEDERYSYFKAFKTHQIYNGAKAVNEYGANDYWERGLVNPHWILADFIHILHPELSEEGYESKFFVQIK